MARIHNSSDSNYDCSKNITVDMMKLGRNELIVLGVIALFLFVDIHIPAFSFYTLGGQDSWDYRKQITLTTNDDITDAQIYVIVDTASLISEGKLNNDCSDLRMTDSTGTMLPYWIETGCNSVSTKVWIKANAQVNTDKYLYMYYGNSGASDGQDLIGVFGTGTVMYTPLGSDSVDLWSGVTGTDNSVTHDGTWADYDGSSSNTNFGDVANTDSLTMTWAFHCMYSYVDGTRDGCIIGKRTDTEAAGDYVVAYYYYSSTQAKAAIAVYSGSATSQSAYVYTDSTENQDAFVVVTFDSNTDTLNIYVNGVLELTSNSITNDILDTSENLYFGFSGQTGEYYDGKMRDVMIWNRVLSSSEIAKLSIDNPSYSFGSEETDSPNTGSSSSSSSYTYDSNSINKGLFVQPQDYVRVDVDTSLIDKIVSLIKTTLSKVTEPLSSLSVTPQPEQNYNNMTTR